MRAVICGANGAMGTLLCGILKEEVVMEAVPKIMKRGT